MWYNERGGYTTLRLWNSNYYFYFPTLSSPWKCPSCEHAAYGVELVISWIIHFTLFKSSLQPLLSKGQGCHNMTALKAIPLSQLGTKSSTWWYWWLHQILRGYFLEGRGCENFFFLLGISLPQIFISSKFIMLHNFY